MGARGTTALIASLGAATAGFWVSGLDIEGDLLRSLSGPQDAVGARLYRAYSEHNGFESRTFFDATNLTSDERASLRALLMSHGYKDKPLFTFAPGTDLRPLTPLLEDTHWKRLAHPASLASRADEIALMATLPGASAMLAHVARDPLGMSRILSPSGPSHVGVGDSGTGEAIWALEAPARMAYEASTALQAILKERFPGVPYVGPEFFAAENHATVRRDIAVCTGASLVVGGLLFFAFVRSWAFLAFLLLGTFVSYLAGFVALRLYSAQMFAIVFAFTSTFVGFNNEYLIHLSGLDARSLRRNWRGLSSAIGTTLIGFLVLLFARSEIIRQIAIVSMGGMAGFLCFLLLNLGALKSIRMRTVAIPGLVFSRPALAGAGLLLAASGAALGVPDVRTRIEEFRFESRVVLDHARHFEHLTDRLSIGNLMAIGTGRDLAGTVTALDAVGALPQRAEALRLYVNPSRQAARTREATQRYNAAVGRLVALLDARGMAIPGLEPHREFTPLEPEAFLSLMGELTGTRLQLTDAGAHYLVLPVAKAPPTALDAHPLHPRLHYDALLSDLSRQMLTLFGLGIVGMVCYLLWVQRSFPRMCSILLPLLAAAVALLTYFRATGQSVTFVHIVGFSLVIALALDYGAIAVSSRFEREDLSKVLLTGMTTLGTFGVLAFARHPVMHALGITVSIGVLAALAFALFVRAEADTPEGECALAERGEAPT